MYKYILIALIFAIGISSCKFSKPVLSHKIYSFTYRDTLTNNICKKNNYHYTNFLNLSTKGGYVVIKRYELKDNELVMIKKTCTKSPSLDMFNMNEMIYEKTYTYENEKKSKIEFVVYQKTGQYRNINSVKTVNFSKEKGSDTEE